MTHRGYHQELIDALAVGERLMVRELTSGTAALVMRIDWLVKRQPEEYQVVSGPRGGIIGIERIK